MASSTIAKKGMAIKKKNDSQVSHSDVGQLVVYGVKYLFYSKF